MNVGCSNERRNVWKGHEIHHRPEVLPYCRAKAATLVLDQYSHPGMLSKRKWSRTFQSLSKKADRKDLVMVQM